MSDSLRPHELQHARPPCPSPTPRVHPDSRPLSQWCHPAISSSAVPFSSCPQSLPASGSFPMNELFAWGGQSTGVSALASFLPKKSQGWSPSEWTGKYSLNTTFSKWISWDISGHQSVRMCHVSIWIQLHRSLENFLMSSFSLNRIGEVYCRISENILGSLGVETILFLIFTTLLFLWLYNKKEEKYIEDAYLCELSYFKVTGSHVAYFPLTNNWQGFWSWQIEPLIRKLSNVTKK